MLQGRHAACIHVEYVGKRTDEKTSRRFAKPSDAHPRSSGNGRTYCSARTNILPERLKRFSLSNGSIADRQLKSRGALPAPLASSGPTSCGNGDQSYLAPALVIPSRVGANDYFHVPSPSTAGPAIGTLPTAPVVNAAPAIATITAIARVAAITTAPAIGIVVTAPAVVAASISG